MKGVAITRGYEVHEGPADTLLVVDVISRVNTADEVSAVASLRPRGMIGIGIQPLILEKQIDMPRLLECIVRDIPGIDRVFMPDGVTVVRVRDIRSYSKICERAAKTRANACA